MSKKKVAFIKIIHIIEENVKSMGEYLNWNFPKKKMEDYVDEDKSR